MYKDSSNKETWYFFAVAGLNITGKLLVTLTETTEFDKHILPIFSKLSFNGVLPKKVHDDNLSEIENQIL